MDHRFPWPALAAAGALLALSAVIYPPPLSPFALGAALCAALQAALHKLLAHVGGARASFVDTERDGGYRHSTELASPSAVAVALTALLCLAAAPAALQARDDAQLLAWRRPPVPAQEGLRTGLLTVAHSNATMAKVAARDTLRRPQAAFAASYDAYFEQFTPSGGCAANKRLVMLSGTDGATYLYVGAH